MSRPLPWNDPARMLLEDPKVYSEPEVFRESCYICRDPEYAQMGLPLCRQCPMCGGHIAADDTVCDDCEYDLESDFPEVVVDGPSETLSDHDREDLFPF